MRDAQDLGAQAWGADRAFWGTSGSTQNLQALILSLADPGDTMLIPMNEHRASWSLAMIAGLDLVPMLPPIDTIRGIENPMTAERVRSAIAADPQAKAVIVVSPTFYGAVADIGSIAEVTRAHGIPLIVDAAWGGAHGVCAGLLGSPITMGPMQWSRACTRQWARWRKVRSS